MRAVVQRVSSASVRVDNEVVGRIGAGLMVLIGATHDDTETIARRMAAKLWGLRIFADAAGDMNLAASDLDLEVLVVSQFTLYGDATRGRRPSFVAAAPRPVAEPLIEAVVKELRDLGATVATGRFGRHMSVSLVNDGPTTLVVEI